MPSPQGSIVDANTIIKRIGRLKNMIQRNEVADYKALSTTILANLNALNTLLQNSDDNQDLSASPTLPIRDEQDQTSNS